MGSLNIQERIEKVKILFEQCKDWETKYTKLISLGKSLSDLDPLLKTEQALVKGCQSQVWLHAFLNDQGKMEIRGDSDAILVKGLVALLIQVYSEATPDEILATPPDFIQSIGFKEHLSPSRTNGLFSMIKQIQLFAQAFIMIRRSMKKPE